MCYDTVSDIFNIFAPSAPTAPEGDWAKRRSMRHPIIIPTWSLQVLSLGFSIISQYLISVDRILIISRILCTFRCDFILSSSKNILTFIFKLLNNLTINFQKFDRSQFFLQNFIIKSIEFFVKRPDLHDALYMFIYTIVYF